MANVQVGEIYRHRMTRDFFRVTDIKNYQIRMICINSAEDKEVSYSKGPFLMSFEKVETEEKVENMEESNILAVYGTLKKGYHNHSLIKNAGLVPFFCPVGMTEAEYFIAGWGFPIVFKDAPKHLRTSVGVELYYFKDESQLEAIDRLEQHPTWYKREPVRIQANLGKEKKSCSAWMYLQPFSNFSETRHDIAGRIQTKDNVATWGYK